MGRRYPTQHGRVEQIDVLRGLAIVLVVFGHVTQGLGRSGKIEIDGTFDFLGNDWVYLFHMPAFFFASGLVLALKPPLNWRELAIGRTATLYYPHVVWGLVYYFIAVVFARYYNSPIVDPGNVGLHLLEILTGQKSWFLPTLLVTTLVLWPLLRIAPYGTAVGTLGLALLGWFVATGWQVPFYLMRLAVFFAVGYAIASWLVERGEIGRTVAGAGALALLALLLPMAALTFEGLSGWFLKIMASAIGVTGMWLAAVALRRVTWIAWLGKASLAIFVLHPMATGFARAALLKVAPDWPAGAYVVLVTLAGICLPALAYWLAMKLQVNWLFVLPIKPARLSKSA